MLARLVSLPMPTVAAVNGHCTAGGGFFALCHDFTIASSEKGLFFMNEIDLGLGFAEGMAKVLTYVRHKIPFFQQILLVAFSCLVGKFMLFLLSHWITNRVLLIIVQNCLDTSL